MIKVVTNNHTKFTKLGWKDFATVEESLEHISRFDILQYDSETTGLGFSYCHLWCIQIGAGGIEYVIDTRSVDIQLYKKDLERCTLIGHNILFDLVFLYAVDIRSLKVIDTQINEICLSLGINFVYDANQVASRYKRDLGSCVLRHLNIKIDKSSQDDIAETGLNSIEKIIYSGNDVKYLEDLHAAQLLQLERMELVDCAKLEYDFSCVLAYMEFCGVYHDPKAWYEKVRDVECDERIALRILNKYFLDNFPDLYEIHSPMNWGSPKQVTEVFKSIGINVIDKKKKESVTEAVISPQKELFPIINHYLLFKQRSKSVSTYGRNWFDYPAADGRIHTKYKQLKETGRTGCGNVKQGPFPNMQNLEADKVTRAAFKGKGPNVLIVCDYSSQEQVITADISEEPALLDFYRRGETDMHSFVTKMRYPEMEDLELHEIKDQYPKERGESKQIGFAVNYGGDGYTISNNLSVSKEEGDRLYDSYMGAFPRLAEYFKIQRQEGINNGYITIPNRFKRKRFIENHAELKRLKKAKNKWLHAAKLSAIERESLNTPAQGFGADMSKLAGVYILKEIVERKWWGKVKIVIFVHDEWVLEAHQSTAPKVAAMIQTEMERAGNELLKNLTITATPEITKHWKK